MCAVLYVRNLFQLGLRFGREWNGRGEKSTAAIWSTVMPVPEGTGAVFGRGHIVFSMTTNSFETLKAVVNRCLICIESESNTNWDTFSVLFLRCVNDNIVYVQVGYSDGSVRLYHVNNGQ